MRLFCPLWSLLFMDYIAGGCSVVSGCHRIALGELMEQLSYWPGMCLWRWALPEYLQSVSRQIQDSIANFSVHWHSNQTTSHDSTQHTSITCTTEIICLSYCQQIIYFNPALYSFALVSILCGAMVTIYNDDRGMPTSLEHLFRLVNWVGVKKCILMSYYGQ